MLKLDEMGMEIAEIAVPAAMALAADPLASLLDTALVGHLGNSLSLSLSLVFLFSST